MYDNVTIQQIQDSLLNAVSAEMDKRPSSLIYAVCAAAALYFAQEYVELNYVNDQTYASTADRQHLILIAKENGVLVKPATATVVKGKFDKDLPVDTRFSATGTPYRFVINEPCTLDKDGFYYAPLRCETLGNLPNESFIGAITPIDSGGAVVEIQDLTTAEIVAVLKPGEDEEDTEELRKRYFRETEWEHYGGNIADYEIMMSRQAGVGACKVIPVKNGGGTVGLVLVDVNYKPCTPEFIQEVKNAVDPVGFEGQGLGKAPIDHKVSIESAKPTAVDVKFSLTYADGQSWATVGDTVKAAVEGYFDKVRHDWKVRDTLVVRHSYVESAILDVPGVVDITGTTLNGGTTNIEIGRYNVPMVGTVTAL